MSQMLLHDIRYALRYLRRSPGFVTAAIVTLAFGIGANTAVFTILNALVIQRLPITDPDGLMSVTSRSASGVQRYVPITAVDELARDGPLRDVCAYNGGFTIAVEANGTPTQALAAFVTGRCLTTFGVMPMLGRPITDDDAPLYGPGKRVALLSHQFWTRLFGADPGAVGRVIRTEGIELTVVGVLPPGFGGLHVDSGADILAPFDTVFPARANRRPVASEILGRLRPDLTLTQAAAELETRWPGVLKATVPTSLAPTEAADLFGTTSHVERMGTGLSAYRIRYGHPLSILLGVTSVLLVLACVNLGGLLLSRLSARATELRVRLALGGSRWRILQQMVLEGLVLSLSGAAIAVPFSFAIVATVTSFLPAGTVERTVAFTPDVRVLAITALVAVAAGVLMSALPIWVAMRWHARTDVLWYRTIIGPTSGWLRGVLVTQVALSVMLVFGAGLLARSLYLLQRADLGVRTSGVLYARLQPLPNGHRGLETASYYPPLLERLAALPGVRSVAASRVFPRAVGDGRPTPIAFVGEPPGDVTAYLESASPAFFQTLGIPLLAGRLPSWSDNATTRKVAVVSESLARALARDGHVLERHVRYGASPNLQNIAIVGVVGNATLGNPRASAVPVIYVPPLQMSRDFSLSNVMVAVDGDPSSATAGIRRVVQEGGREYAHEVVGLDELFARAPSGERMSATLAGAVSVLAIVLALVGIHGALAYAVSRRTREIGVRLALGSTPRAAAAAVLREACALTLIGLAIGLPGAYFAARTLRTLMFQITETDPLTFAAAAVFFLALGCAAAMLPARRATAIDPAVTLRVE